MKTLTKKKVRKTLPNKLWETLRLALADLKLVEKNPLYCVNMEVVHAPINPGYCESKPEAICEVCLGGSVMAMNLGVYINNNAAFYEPYFLQSTMFKLNALDCLRRGNITIAVDYFYNHLKYPEKKVNLVVDRDIQQYSTDPKKKKQFYKDMYSIVRYLKKLNL